MRSASVDLKELPCLFQWSMVAITNRDSQNRKIFILGRQQLLLAVASFMLTESAALNKSACLFLQKYH